MNQMEKICRENFRKQFDKAWKDEDDLTNQEVILTERVQQDKIIQILIELLSITNSWCMSLKTTIAGLSNNGRDISELKEKAAMMENLSVTKEDINQTIRLKLR